MLSFPLMSDLSSVPILFGRRRLAQRQAEEGDLATSPISWLTHTDPRGGMEE
jgi:hypothetical protein